MHGRRCGCHLQQFDALVSLLFEQSGSHSTLQSVSNPYECSIGGRVFLGNSGQCVDDVRACSAMGDPLDILGSLVTWGHLAPTAPDTLGMIASRVGCAIFSEIDRPLDFNENMSTNIVFYVVS